MRLRSGNKTQQEEQHNSVQNEIGEHRNIRTGISSQEHMEQQSLHRGHSVWALMLMKTGSVILVVFFFVVPITVRMFPWIMTEFLFLHRVSWPPHNMLKLDKPESFGLNGTRNIILDTDRDVTIGMWHVLPWKLNKQLEEESYQQLLSHSSDPIILYLHGNAGSRAGYHRRMLYKVLSRSGFHVVCPDYRGYGSSSGYPSEAGVVHDAMEAYHWILKHKHPQAKVYIWGHSLGSGIGTKAARLLTEGGAHVDGLILEAPFTSIAEAMAEYPMGKIFSIMPWFTWAFGESLRSEGLHFTSDLHIQEVLAPVLILHAEDDGLVPYHLGKKLYDIALEKKKNGGVHFVKYEAALGYGHKHICKDPNLPNVIRNFAGLI